MDELNPIEKHDADLARHTRRQSAALAHASGFAAAFLTVAICFAIAWFTLITFGYFKVIFGVATGIAVKHLGRGAGPRFAHIAGLYAALAVVGYESLIAFFFVASNDPAAHPEMLREGSREILKSAYSFSRLVLEFAEACVAYFLAYRIGLNPMAKDELDYLLEAKGIDVPPKGAPGWKTHHRRRR